MAADLILDKVSKRYRVAEARAPKPGLVGRIQSLIPAYSDFWAVRDVSFEVPRGEALGIIGHNGAGKSTILKLLSNITRPTSGLITIHGRLSSLIEVGSGFHPELTGGENVFLAGSILGMSRAEISAKFASIVEFAEIQRFIDTPVKRYSSGMYVRLGFAIAAHLNPDVLLLDEVLAVGDAVFQAKCIQRVMDLRDSGTTIVFISHDLGAVEKLCDRVILLKRGEIIADGPPRDVILEYQRAGFVATGSKFETSKFNTRRAEVLGVTFHDAKGSQVPTFYTGQPFVARIEYRANEPIPNATFDLTIKAPDNDVQCQLNTRFAGDPVDLPAGEGRAEFLVEELSLQPGLYRVDASVDQMGELQGLDWHVDCAHFQVLQGKQAGGRFYMPHIFQQRSYAATGKAAAELVNGNREE